MEQTAKKKQGFLRTLIRQFKEFKRLDKKIVYLYMFLGIISTAIINLSGIYLTKLIIDGLTDYAPNELYYFIATLISTLIVFMFFRRWCDAKTEVIFIDVRIRQYLAFNKKFMEVDYPNMEDPNFQNKVQTSLTSLGGDGDGFQRTYTLTYRMLGLLTTVIATAVVVGLFNWLLILACLFTAVVSTYAVYLMAKFDYKQRDELSEKFRQEAYFYNTTYDFTFGKDIRLYQLQDTLEKEHSKSVKSLTNSIKKLAKFDFKASLLELIPLLLQDILAYALVLWSYFEGQLTIAELSMYLVAVGTLSTYLRQLGKGISDIRAGIRYVVDYYNFMDDQSFINYEGLLEPLTETFDIEFRNVSFKYPNTENWIIRNLSMKIEKGEKLAIVGANGAGKTTLVKLICGLFKPTEGQILINGVDATKFNKAKFQEMFSVVFQDIHVYAASVMENVIGMQDDETARERAKMALEAVGLKNKIESLPNQYDHQILKVIDPEGVDFSGGERQKLVIARALFKNGPVVILDEPTAALDALAEAKIYEEFNALAGNKTSIYVSHRLSSTKFCDHIALFDGQSLKEYGTHDELMAQKGIYHNMFVTQGKYYQPSVGGEEGYVQNVS
ncbi:ABC transporter ATP-binding protein [Acholeplasma equirhinis]|uniref:ABC transporter ATP-binding protein n=1 Tax=Acholeplasma equirhinis TaxID=555393 RepID=UPI00197A7CEB|nr:ABC transporter ATP-binding protein [Acholeplasma equirhinis]MBN3490022.1 ABC transporter ATP-binding protein [Acholeplasma equirhinis]